MATVTGFTSARMLIIENSAIIDGEVVGDDLILEPYGFATAPGTYPKINAGNVRGPIGLTGPTGEVTTAAMTAAIAAEHAAGAIDGTQLASGSVTNAKIAALAVQESNIAASAVTEGKIGTGAVTNDKIAADAVNGAKIANDSINSEHYVDGSIDNAHLANDSVNGSKIANDSINSEHYVNASIDNAHLADDAVNFNEIVDSTSGGTLTTGAQGKVLYMKILNWVFIIGHGTDSDSTWGTLPVGYRPNTFVSIPAVSDVSAETADRVIIGSDGNINVPTFVDGGVVRWTGCFPTTGL